MDFIISALLVLIAMLHVFFMILEMFLWTRPLGRKIFRMSEEAALSTQKLAANQGLYNGFLAAGCIWALVSGELSVQFFFLGCIFVAGIFGALSVNRRIFWIQAFPAMLTLLLVFQFH